MVIRVARLCEPTLGTEPQGISTTTWLRLPLSFLKSFDATPVGVGKTFDDILTQGSPADGPTLGFGAESRWDSLKKVVGKGKAFNAGVWNQKHSITLPEGASGASFQLCKYQGLTFSDS